MASSYYRGFESLSRTNTSPSMPPQKATNTKMEPWRQPGHLPLPALEYGSDLKVWQWRVRLTLKHLCLWRDFPISLFPPQLGRDEDKVAANKYCAALVVSCISEQILSDLVIILLALSPKKDLALHRERELPEEPTILFEHASRMVAAVQKVQKDGTQRLRDFLSGDERPSRPEDVLLGLDALPRKGDNVNHWLHTILIAVLLIRKYELADLGGANLQSIIKRTHDMSGRLVEDDFTTLMNEVMEVRRQQFSN